MSFASSVRQFFEELFYSKLVEQLRNDLLFARTDIDRVRQDKDQTIAELRSEKAQLTARMMMYETKAGLRAPSETPTKPNFGVDFSATLPKSRWQIIQEENDARIAREEAEEATAKEKAATAA
jgi:hypothetical protein